jgi:hypothetical protein
LLFTSRGVPINAASILPGILERFGDIDDILAQIAPRRTFIAAGVDERYRGMPYVTVARELFTKDARLLVDWLVK